jgi:ribonucleoside-triphosphate reductase
MVYVIKRLKNKEEFNASKIEVAIKKAFFSCNKEIDKNNFNKIMQRILSSIEILGQEEINIETIQDIIEETLMRFCYYDVAKSFILYREKHKNIRNNVERNIQFIDNFIKSDNTANATIDDNSNVSTHNIAVMNTEIHKEDNKETNIRIWYNKIKELYGKELAEQFIVDLNTICYAHDLSSQIGMPYCVAISLYPFLLNGIKDIGGLSAAPKNIDSFCGLFINLVFSIASQYKGAVAVPGVLLCMDYFLRKEWGDDYYIKNDVIISSDHCLRKMTIKSQIHQYFQQICYSLMQPSGSRGNQACFWNLSIFDKPFFDTMYGDFYFPDGTRPKWESLSWLQKDFMHWLNQERLKCILTFPVVSLCLIYQDHKFLDEDLYQFAAQEYSEGNSFFTYISDSADSLSSCCRLSSKISKPQFNFTNGQLSEMTGSKNVITLNLNRIIQDWCKSIGGVPIVGNQHDSLKFYLINILERVYKYQTAYNEILKYLHKNDLLTVYNAGFIDMKKQYLTIGINGLNQAAEYLGMECNKNKEYEDFCSFIFSTIKEQNTLHKTDDCMFNTEFVPAESAAIKLYNRDKKDGYWTPNDTNLYASYIFKPNDPNISVLDKLYLHGNSVCGDNLDGGSAAHIGLDSHLSKEQYLKIIKYAAEVGCKYLTFNVPNSECDDCGYITKVPIKECPKCDSKNISYYDRVIG